ncbi:HAD family hydrolase [Nanoarchaeota archaeon]
MRFDGVIFDLDGTLTHTSPTYIYDTLTRAFKKFGITPSKEDMDGIWFRGDRDDIISERFGLDLKEFWPTYQEYGNPERRKGSLSIYSDVDFVQKLKRMGLKTGIVTGAPNNMANLQFDMLGRENYDSLVVAQPENGLKPKPHPQSLEKCVKALKLPKEKVLYVGNADEDVIMAKSAGITDVHIDRREYKFTHLNPSVTVHSLYEIKELLTL